MAVRLGSLFLALLSKTARYLSQTVHISQGFQSIAVVLKLSIGELGTVHNFSGSTGRPRRMEKMVGKMGKSGLFGKGG